MKKILLSLSALVILGLPQLMAQTIPNLDFETWTPDSYSTGNAPDPNGGIGSSGWWDFNVMSNSLLGKSNLTVLEGSSSPAPESGSHYAVIVSDSMSPTSYGYLATYGFIYPDTNGLMFLGNISAAGIGGVSVKTGVPYGGGRSHSFSFYYRYIPNGADTCSCTIAMYHFNSVNHTRELIGGGYWDTAGTVSSWKLATVPISYDSMSSVPDTIFIQFSACSLFRKSIPKRHDTLDIDNSSILGIYNIAEQHDNVTLYPNPANSEINLAVSGQYRATSVEVYDITGRAIGTYAIRNNFLTINTQSFNNGLYIYKLLDDSGNQLNVGKFSVVK